MIAKSKVIDNFQDLSISRTMKTLKTLILSLAVISLAACTSTTSTPDATNPAPTEQTATTTEASPTESPSVASSPAPTSPSEFNPAEVSFKVAPKEGQIGFIDTINGSNKLEQTVAKNTPLTLSGWAVVPNSGKPADLIIITTADKQVIATAPVNVDRPDVAKALKKDELKKSGWNVKIDPAQITTEQVSLIAWAYDASTKEALPLNNVYKLNIK